MKKYQQEYIPPECEVLSLDCAGVLMGSRFDDNSGTEYLGDDGGFYL